MKKFISDLDRKGLLTNFIMNKFDEYVEPTRKGTPRGEIIGLSKVKYGASLFALTNIEIKEQAKILRVSYGLIRKWRTEESFHSALNKHVSEFVRLFVKHIKNTIVEMGRPSDIEFSGKTLQKLEKSQTQNHFLDAELYSFRLIFNIYQHIPFTMFSENIGLNRFYLHFSSNLVQFITTKATRSDERRMLLYKKWMNKMVLQKVIKYLSKKELSSQQRLLAVEYLKLLERYL